MKKILLVLISLLLIRQSSAEILIYNYTATGQEGGGGASAKSAVTGKLYYDLPTTNWILVSCDRRARKISVLLSGTNSVAVGIQGSGNLTFTAFAALPPGGLVPGAEMFELIDFPGVGPNALLKIDKTNTITFPRVLTYEVSSVTFGGWGAPTYSIALERSVFSAEATKVANHRGKNINDLANALVKSLQAAGYSGP